MAKDNIFTRAKELRKKHPKMAWKDLVSMAAKKKAVTSVTGVKRKKAKKITGIKKPVTVKRAKIGKVVKHRSPGAGATATYTAGMKILKQIESYELKLQKARTKEEKDLLKTVINQHHDRFDRLTKR